MTNAQFIRPAKEPNRGRWIAAGVVQLVLAAPMLATLAAGALAIGVMGVADSDGSVSPLAVPLMLLLGILGPVLGLTAALLLRLTPAVRRAQPAARFALAAGGLLCGTAAEYALVLGQLH